MADFENFAHNAAQISLEIERKLVALGIDADNQLALRALARDILAYKHQPGYRPASIEEEARQNLFGLVALMLRNMREGADLDREVSGSPIWKALARALWSEKEG